MVQRDQERDRYAGEGADPRGGYVIRCTPGFAGCIALEPVAMKAPRTVWLNGVPFKPSEMPL